MSIHEKKTKNNNNNGDRIHGNSWLASPRNMTHYGGKWNTKY